MKFSKSTQTASRLAVPAGGVVVAAALAFSQRPRRKRPSPYVRAARHGAFSA